MTKIEIENRVKIVKYKNQKGEFILRNLGLHRFKTEQRQASLYDFLIFNKLTCFRTYHTFNIFVIVPIILVFPSLSNIVYPSLTNSGLYLNFIFTIPRSSFLKSFYSALITYIVTVC